MILFRNRLVSATAGREKLVQTRQKLGFLADHEPCLAALILASSAITRVVGREKDALHASLQSPC